MRPGNGETHDDDDDEIADGSERAPSPGGLAHWIAEQYAGDERFVAVEVEEPGPLEEEAARVKLICDERAHFLVAILPDDAVVRVGLATGDKSLVTRLEAATEDAGGVLTDLLAAGAEAEEELEHEAEHWHDDMDYFATDIPFRRDADLVTDALRDEVAYYLDAYLGAFYDMAVEED
jgi:hypothetical protein